MGHHETLYQLIHKILFAIFPVIWGLVVFSFYRFKRVWRNNTFYLLLLLITTGLIVRVVHWSAIHRYAGRYTGIIIIAFIILSIPGFFTMSHFLFIKTNKRFNRKSYYYFTLCFITIICLGKSLRPQRSRPWQEDILTFIKPALPDKNKFIVVITTKHDRRSAYYANAKGLIYSVSKDVLKSNLNGMRIEGHTLLNKLYSLQTPNLFMVTELDEKSMPLPLKNIPKTKIKMFLTKKKKHRFTLYRLDIKTTK
jgi:hypothetical protein